jgi:[ribosomal protein S18]-alanine N-acetyltransferase
MNTAVTIARADTESLAAIMPVMKRAFHPDYGEAWTTPFGLAGFALARVVLDSAELMLLAVDPQWQQRGIGFQLLDATRTSCRAMGAASLHVEVRVNNHALRFYARHGFIRIGSRSNYYKGTNGDRLDAATLNIALD